MDGHDCRTVSECGWSGTKNGALLALAGLIPECLAALERIQPRQVVRVGALGSG